MANSKVQRNSKLKSGGLVLFLLSLVFTLVNYSESNWHFFNSFGGLALAKVGPEFIGVVFYLVLAFLAFKKINPKFRLGLEKIDFYLILLLVFLSLISRLKEFKLYFYADDFYYWLNREGTSYSVYQWGPWLSSRPGWVWELSRLLAGYNPLSYQIASLLSHFLFGLGVYFLAKFLSKKRLIGFFAAFFFLITTIHFEAFQWLSHVSNFGWQGFLMTISVLALIWQLKKGKGKTPPYLSSFIMMATLFAGTARTGAILPILSITDAWISFGFSGPKKFISWIKGLLKRQWVFYLPVLVFAWTRGLWAAANPRYEVVSSSLINTFFWLVGVVTVPPEVIKFFSFMSPFWLGAYTIIFGIISFILIILLLLITMYMKKKISLYIFGAFIWTILFALYFTFFAPHVPVTADALRESTGPHHLAYPSSVGISLIFGLFFYYANRWLFYLLKSHIGTRKSLGITLGFSAAVFFLLLLQLDNSYKKFLYLPYSRPIIREELFFDSYRKYIPLDTQKLVIYYDDNYLKNKWNFVPTESYYWAFWEGADVKILKGRENLEKFVKETLAKGNLEDEITSLYYVIIDFEFPKAEDKTEELRKQILTGKY